MHKRTDNGQEDKLPPHDENAELMALACCIEDISLVPHFADAGLFYTALAQVAFLHLAKLHKGLGAGKSMEPWMVQSELAKSVTPVDSAKIVEVVNALPSADGWPYWRERLVECGSARKELQLRAMLGTGDPQVRDSVAKGLKDISIGTAAKSSKSLAVFIKEAFVYLQAAQETADGITGIRLPWSRLTRSINGIEPSRFYVVGARPSVGKSAWLEQAALYVARNSGPVSFVTMEMSGEECALRWAQIESQVSARSFRDKSVTEAEMKAFTRAAADVAHLPILVHDQCQSLYSVESAISMDVQQRGAKAAFIDYLGLISVPGFSESRVAEVTMISNSLKRLAMNLRIPIVAAAQLNRASVREGKAPTLVDLRDSGSIEQDADVVILLHTAATTFTEPRANVLVNIAKNRSGPTGATDSVFLRPTTTFREVDSSPQE